MQEIQFALRMLRRNPGFSAIIIVTLGLGIGLNTAIFSNINAVLLRPLPYPAPEQLVVARKDWKPEWAPNGEMSPYLDANEIVAWEERNTVFSQLAAYLTQDATLTGSGDAGLVKCTRVSASFPALFGLRPALGRVFLPEEHRPAGPPVAILGYGLWQSRFGGSAQVLGQTITLDDKPFTVVGMAPSSFQFIEPFDLLLPMALTPGKSGFAQVIGRLKPGIGIEQARAGLDAIFQQVRQPSTPGRVLLTPLHEHLVGYLRTSLLICLGAAGFVLLIACANVANLLLARGAGRRKEIAIRTALGAGRFRNIRLLLTESLVLALLGGLLGLLLAFCGNGLIRPLLGSLPTTPPARIDGAALAFTLLVALLTGLVFGAAPAWEGSRASFGNALKDGTRGGGSGSRYQRRLTSLLVSSEVMLALVLLLGTGLLVKSFVRLRGVDLGFRPDRILSLRIELSQAKYPDARSQSAYFAQVIEQIRQLPGVDTVGADAALPLSGYSIGMSSTSEGKPTEFLSAGIVNADYFRTMGIPLKKGRLFTEEDRDGKPKVALVNESYARSRFAGEEPLGKEISEATIVGVVGDVRQGGPKSRQEPLVYFCYRQSGFRSMSLAVRTRGNPLPLSKTIRDQIQRIDRTQPIHGLATLEQKLSDTLSPQRLNMQLASALGALALGLVALGIYGVLSFSVAQRVHEIGVRMALGAQSGNVIRLVIGQGLKLTLAGVTAGWLAAFGLTRYLSSLLYGVTALDPSTFVEASAFLLLMALLACYWPARRAAQVDPMTALRCE